MNTWLWIVAVLLGLAFAGSGLLKLTTPRERLLAADMGWVEDFSDGAVKGIGVLEVLAALGLVVSPFVGLPWGVPAAAIGLMLLMLGAACTSSTNDASRSCTGETFTDITSGWSCTPDQDTPRSQVSRSARRPSSTIRPVRSATGMNTSGGTAPSSSSYQRARASTPTTAPLERSTTGW